jgi:hypothetical protein
MTAPFRRILWGVGIAVAMLVVVSAWRSVPTRGEPVASRAGETVGGAPAAASAPADASLLATHASVPAIGVAAESMVPPSQDQARTALMQRMKADWCGFGAAEQERQTEAIFEKVSANGGMVGKAAIDEMNRTPGAQVMAEAVAQVRQRWVGALLQRGDPRSLAVAARLGGADGDEAAARARLQALARTSGDPMVTALALHWPCKSSACRNIDAAQWSRLEPANLQAWLALLGDAGARRTQGGYVLERIASEARYSRSYAREFAMVLFSLPQTEVPGLASQAELQLIDVVTGAWPSASWAPLTQMCRTGLGDVALLQRCGAVAELMWQADDLLEHSLAMALVREMVAMSPALRARWEPRARVLEAVQQWSSSVWERRNSDTVAAKQLCELATEYRRHLQGQTAQGEWNRWHAEMKAEGVDEAALSVAWRRHAGRGLLDPVPVPSSASGAH